MHFCYEVVCNRGEIFIKCKQHSIITILYSKKTSYHSYTDETDARQGRTNIHSSGKGVIKYWLVLSRNVDVTVVMCISFDGVVAT